MFAAPLLPHPLQSLPVEVYRSREELERLSVAELKRLLEVRPVHAKCT